MSGQVPVPVYAYPTVRWISRAIVKARLRGHRPERWPLQPDLWCRARAEMDQMAKKGMLSTPFVLAAHEEDRPNFLCCGIPVVPE